MAKSKYDKETKDTGKPRYGDPPDLSPYCVCEEMTNKSRIHLGVCRGRCDTYDVCWEREKREEFLSEHNCNPNATGGTDNEE
jgi:hypothetical protein